MARNAKLTVTPNVLWIINLELLLNPRVRKLLSGQTSVNNDLFDGTRSTVICGDRRRYHGRHKERHLIN